MKKLVPLFLVFSIILSGYAQDLDEILEKESTKGTDVVLGTFNGTRILNGHSIETREKGILEFLISHRFGRVNSGFDDLFGLDDSNIRLGFEYSFTDNLVVAIGRSSFEKTFDGYVKYRLLKQKTGAQQFPISVTLFGSAARKSLKDYDPIDKPSFADRLVYSSQLLIAKKFNDHFSFQITPTYIHFNRVPFDEDPNDIFALGFGTRVKISKRVSLNGEYFYATNSFESVDTKNSLALGIDIETGGHIFQLIFANSRSMIEKGFIAETTGNFFKGDIHFGFNISRAFQISKTKNKQKLY